MFSFIELKPTQKQYILEIMKRFKHESPQITLAEIKEYHQVMLKQRDKTGMKLGYPNWLIVADNKIAKSLYNLPIPTIDEEEDFYNGNVDPVINLNRFSPLLRQTIDEFKIKI
jgi:hypothetical protein